MNLMEPSLTHPPIQVIRPRREADQPWLLDLWNREWGGDTMVSRGRVYRLEDVEAVMAVQGGAYVGAATFVVLDEECELLSLNSLVEARKRKPSIPRLGLDGIPLHDEIEMRKVW